MGWVSAKIAITTTTHVVEELSVMSLSELARSELDDDDYAQTMVFKVTWVAAKHIGHTQCVITGCQFDHFACWTWR